MTTTYYPIKGVVLKLEQETRNHTMYSRAFGLSAIHRIKSSDKDVSGWFSHYDRQTQGAKLLFLRESFALSGNDVIARGYIKRDEHTSSMLDDVKAGFRHIPVSIVSHIIDMRREVSRVTSEGYEVTREVMIDGDIYRIDGVANESCAGCHIEVDFDNPVTEIPERANVSSSQAMESVREIKADSDWVVVDEGDFSKSTTQRIEEAFGAPIKPEKTETAPKPVSAIEKQQAASEDVVTHKEEEHETMLKEKLTVNTTQESATPPAEQVTEIENVFGEDIKRAESAEYDAFIAQRSINAHTSRLETFSNNAMRVFSAEGVDALNGIINLVLESYAESRGVKPHQLSDADFLACKKKARQQYLKRESASSQSVASRLQNNRGSDNLISPNFVIAQQVIDELNASGKFGRRFEGLKWGEVVKDKRVRKMLITKMKEGGRAVRENVNSFVALQQAYSVVEESRQQMESFGHYLQSDEIAPQIIDQVSGIPGIQTRQEGTIFDDDFIGSMRVYAELGDCIPTIIAALCALTNPLLGMLNPLKSNRVVKHTYEICRPDNARIITQELPMTYGTPIDFESNGIVGVYVQDNSTTPPTWVKLSKDYASDYIIYQDSSNPDELSLLILNSDIFDDYGDGTTATFLVETMPKMDVCGVPLLVDVKRTVEEVRGEHLPIAIERCDAALSAFLDNYGYNIVDDALRMAVQVTDDYWTEVLMSRISMAADYCFSMEVRQAIQISQETGTPFVSPEMLRDCWNATSIPLYDGDDNTNGTFEGFIGLVRSLRFKCNGKDDALVTIVLPVQLEHILSGWAISNHVVNQAGNILTDTGSNVIKVANMNVIKEGQMEVVPVDYVDGTGATVTVNVMMGTVHLLGPNALYGEITRTSVQDRGTVSRVTNYVCDSDPEGEGRQLVMPTGVDVQQITSYARFYVDPQDVTALKVVIPLAPSNSCGLTPYPSVNMVN